MSEVLSFREQKELLATTEKAYNAALDRLETHIRKRAFELTAKEFSEEKAPDLWSLVEQGHIPSVFAVVRDILWKGVLEVFYDFNLEDGSEVIQSKTGSTLLSFERRELLRLLDEDFILLTTEYGWALESYTEAQTKQTSFTESLPFSRPKTPEAQWQELLTPSAQK